MGRRRPRSPGPSGPSDSLHSAIVEDERDLHALTADEAAVALEIFLAGSSERHPGAVVRVITGRGNRSRGGPVLLPRVRELLVGRLAPYVADFVVETGGGSYRIRVRAVR